MRAMHVICINLYDVDAKLFTRPLTMLALTPQSTTCLVNGILQPLQHCPCTSPLCPKWCCPALPCLCNVSSQIYLLLSCCPCEGRLSGIVDVPNAVCTLAIPTAIFDRDVRPKKGGIPVQGVSVKTDVARSTYDGDLPLTRCLCHSATQSTSSSVVDLSAAQVAGAKPADTCGAE